MPKNTENRNSFDGERVEQEQREYAINVAHQCLQLSLREKLRSSTGFNKTEFTEFATLHKLEETPLLAGTEEERLEAVKKAIHYLLSKKAHFDEDTDLRIAYEKILRNGIYAIYHEKIIASQDAYLGISQTDRENGPIANQPEFLATVKRHVIALTREIPVNLVDNNTQLDAQEQDLYDKAIELTQGYLMLVPKLLSQIEMSPDVESVVASIWSEHINNPDLLTSRVEIWQKAVQFYELFGISDNEGLGKLLGKNINVSSASDLLKSVAIDRQALLKAIKSDDPSQGDYKPADDEQIPYIRLTRAWRKGFGYGTKLTPLQMQGMNTLNANEKLDEIDLTELKNDNVTTYVLDRPTATIRDAAYALYANDNALTYVILNNPNAAPSQKLKHISEELLHIMQMEAIAESKGRESVDAYFKLTGEAYADALISSITAVVTAKAQASNSVGANSNPETYRLFSQSMSSQSAYIENSVLSLIIKNKHLSLDELVQLVVTEASKVSDTLGLEGLTPTRLILQYLTVPREVDDYVKPREDKEKIISTTMIKTFGEQWVLKPQAKRIFFDAVRSSATRGGANMLEAITAEANYIRSQI